MYLEAAVAAKSTCSAKHIESAFNSGATAYIMQTAPFQAPQQPQLQPFEIGNETLAGNETL